MNILLEQLQFHQLPRVVGTPLISGSYHERLQGLSAT